MIGQTISHYQILAKLGEGGMGVVYKAEDTNLDRPVALKFLAPELTRDPDAKARFIHEAKAASALDHPNVCNIHEIAETADGQLFISMACYEGESLKERISRGPLPLDEAVDIAQQVARGLIKAHEQNIVHRDIKPANIFLTTDGLVKVVDFGLAKLAGQTRLTRTGTTLGTAVYMSPEQIRGEEVDPRTDIWSLGVSLYEMTTGQLPYRGDHEQAVIYSILNEEPEPVTGLRAGVPRALECVVNKALAKNPGERYKRVDEILVDLNTLKQEIESGIEITRPAKARLPKKKHAYWFGGFIALLLLLIVIGLNLLSKDSKTIDSIAVLPLSNLSGDPEQEYFVDGMTEALIMELSKIGVLRVISRTSVMRYRETDKPLAQIARELNVDAIVEGSVLRSAERVRITAQLIGAKPERHLWADNYDRDLGDILVLSSEVAQTIAREIKVTLTPQEQTQLANVRAVNPEAHDLYLRGKYHYYKMSKEETAKANEYFQKAIEADSSFAKAYAGLAASYEYQAWAGYRPLDEAKSQIETLVKKALEIDETLAEAYLALSGKRFYLDWDWLGGEEEIKRSIDLNPSLAEAHYEYAYFLVAMGRFEESIAEAKRALQLDPVSFLTNWTLAYMYFLARQYERAIEQYWQVAELEPDQPVPHSGLARIYSLMGRYDDAVRAHKKAMALWNAPPETVAAKVAALDSAYGESGPEGYWTWHLEQLRGQYDRQPAATAKYYAQLGDKDQAFAWLEKAYEKHDGPMFTLKVHPLYDPLRDDPRFQDLLRRMNFPEDETQK